MTNPTIRRALSVIGSNGTASSTDCSPTAYITQNWRGKPLVSHKVIIQLIAATSTDKGLTVTCDLDGSRGIKDSELLEYIAPDRPGASAPTSISPPRASPW
jgi:hypothetical protein